MTNIHTCFIKIIVKVRDRKLNRCSVLTPNTEVQCCLPSWRNL